MVFALNGLYQRSSWWTKGGKETMFEDVDAVTSLPSVTSPHSGFGSSFQVWGVGCVGWCRLWWECGWVSALVGGWVGGVCGWVSALNWG